MDPFSIDSELINIHAAFHQAQYQTVTTFDTSPFSAVNALPARLLQLRAQIAAGEASAVAVELSGDTEPALRAVRALATVVAGEDVDGGVTEALALAADETAAQDHSVQTAAGSALVVAGKLDEAIKLLEAGRNDGNSTCLWGSLRRWHGEHETNVVFFWYFLWWGQLMRLRS